MFILLVEDEDLYAKMIWTFLEQNGYTDLKRVDNALECLQQVHVDRVPDIIVLDYNLGNLDGVSTLKQIRSFRPDLKVILLSGQKDVKVAVQSIKKGAREYIIKEGGREFERLLSIIREIEAELAQKKESEKPIAKLFNKVKHFLMNND
jgi:DNA-binding NtrC family response regulator